MEMSGTTVRNAALLLLVLGAAMLLSGHHRHKGSYLTATVERGDIADTVSALGTLQPLEFVDVGTQVTGQLKTLYVKVGNEVHKGDLIAEVDPTLFASRVGMTKASLKKVRAELTEKRIMRHLAQQVYLRNKDLNAIQAASKEVLEQSKAALDGVTAQIEALEAETELYSAQLNGDQANLQYTKIFAPMSGTVVAITAREGQTLVANQQAPIILRIADLNTMTVWAQVSEADVPRIAQNNPVFFSPIGLPGKRWHAQVRQILPTPESINSVILYDVLFDVSNRGQLLKPQMSVQTSFIIRKAEHTLLVPTAALHHRPRAGSGVKEASLKVGKKSDAPNDDPEDVGEGGKREYVVRVLTESGEVEERPVVVGVRSRLQAEILSGLAEGEDVIIGSPDGNGNKHTGVVMKGSTTL